MSFAAPYPGAPPQAPQGFVHGPAQAAYGGKLPASKLSETREGINLCVNLFVCYL